MWEDNKKREKFIEKENDHEFDMHNVIIYVFLIIDRKLLKLHKLFKIINTFNMK